MMPNLFIIFLYKALCNIIKSTAEPIYAEYIGKFQIQSIDLDTLTLGTIPPAIHGKQHLHLQRSQFISLHSAN